MRYEFAETTEEKLNVFRQWLYKQRYHPTTIRQYSNYAGLFLQWLEKGSASGSSHYEVLTSFILELKAGGRIQNLNRVILSIRYYYRSIESGSNPTSGLYIRGSRSSVVSDVIGFDRLAEIYATYPALDDRTKRNKVILGLLIFQGVTTYELHKLEPAHVRLREGKMYIPGSPKSNSRVLDLEAVQLLDLQEYLSGVRPRMLENVHGNRAGRKPEQIDPEIVHRLFFSENGIANIKNSLHHLFRQIRKINPKIKSAGHIRQSVLTHWLKTQDVRIVQYKAGHRYVSSTERYQEMDMEELKDALKKYHPLRSDEHG